MDVWETDYGRKKKKKKTPLGIARHSGLIFPNTRDNKSCGWQKKTGHVKCAFPLLGGGANKTNLEVLPSWVKDSSPAACLRIYIAQILVLLTCLGSASTEKSWTPVRCFSSYIFHTSHCTEHAKLHRIAAVRLKIMPNSVRFLDVAQSLGISFKWILTHLASTVSFLHLVVKNISYNILTAKKSPLG